MKFLWIRLTSPRTTDLAGANVRSKTNSLLHDNSHSLQNFVAYFINKPQTFDRYGSKASNALGRVGILAALALILMSFVCTFPARSHSLGESYLFLSLIDGGINGHIDIPLNELGDVLFEGQVTDGILTPKELNTNIEQLKSYVSKRVGLGTPTTSFPIRFTTYQIMAEAAIPFVQLKFLVNNLKETPTILKVRYSLLFATNPLHRALLIVKSNQASGSSSPGEEVSLIFTKDNQIQELDLRKVSLFGQFVSYLEHGMFHIAIGFDHILFLVALLLSAVLERRDRRWIPCDSFRRAFLNVVKIVTLFTVAHSITLGLAALQIITLPTRFVESMIALTVIVAAVHNIFPVLGKRTGPIIFLFGLFHGFGFASVLSGLGFQKYSLATTLFGFNLGVEIGQLIVVMAILPILYFIRGHNYYGRLGIRLGSSVIAIFGAIWLLERTMGFSI